MSLTFIDLFAGIGGFRIALEKAGATCVFSSEINKYAKQVYKENFLEEPAGDITQIKEADIPAHDILCGGFPCQAFSLLGMKKGFSDTRGTLFFEVVRIAKYHKPKIIFLENVPGLVAHDKGNTFTTIQNNLTGLGYKVYWKKLEATMFGVPQKRKRIFIVAVRNDIKKEFVFPNGTLTSKTMKDIMETNVNANYFISEERYERIFSLKKNGITKFDKFIIEPDDFAHALLAVDYEVNLLVDKTTPTDSFYNKQAKFRKSGSPHAAIINTHYLRRLMPLEYKRLQGFPEDFKMSVSNKQAYYLLGNAVAVPVISAIFEQIKILIR
jgi:DNA (cytosine-5)-methyltransferase 1